MNGKRNRKGGQEEEEEEEEKERERKRHEIRRNAGINFPGRGTKSILQYPQ